MDQLLFDWLNDYTFPQEARFLDPSSAEILYGALADDFVRQGTFHVNIFTTIHADSAGILFRLLEQRGLNACVGKVNIDQNSPQQLCETMERSLREAERFLAEYSGNRVVQAIIASRFASICSIEPLTELGKIAKRYHCPMQTHGISMRVCCFAA